MSKKKKKELEKKKKRKLLLIILLFTFTLIVLSSATYAWFSSNKNAIIEAIDINVATVTGIQISENAIDWKNELTKEELQNAKSTYLTALNQFPDTLHGVSTDGSVSNGRMNMFFGTTNETKDGDYSVVATQETEINCYGDEECEGHHYIAFDVFFLTTAPTDLVVTPNSSVVNRDEAERGLDTGGQNSARVGFLVLGTIPDTSGPYAAQALNGAQGSVIWEPNYDVHTEGGVAQAARFYNTNVSTSGAPRLTYRGVNQAFSTPVLLSETRNSPYFTTMNPQIATTKVFNEEQYLTHIGAGITKMRIYMWLEGEDVDFENNASDGKLTFNLEIAMPSGIQIKP